MAIMPIEWGKIREYATATAAARTAYLDDPKAPVPPTFLATVVFWMPIGNRLKRLGELEANRMEMSIEGVMAIQAGANPRVIAQKLLSLLPPAERAAAEEASAEKAA